MKALNGGNGERKIRIPELMLPEAAGLSDLMFAANPGKRRRP